MEQMGLMANEAEAYGTKAATPEQIRVKEHERKRSRSIEDVIPEGLPVETVEHCLEDTSCPNCGSEMTVIGTEVQKHLKVTPPQFTGAEDIYYTYACKVCEKETDETVVVRRRRNRPCCPAALLLPKRLPTSRCKSS